jgi:hypothetical protein
VKNYSVILLGICTLFLFSCEKKDKAIVLPPKGDEVAIQVGMGSEYTEHYYVSLENQSIVHTGHCNAWDIAFACGSNDLNIYMNGGIGISAFPTGKSSFASVNWSDTALVGNNWHYDASTGEVDSSVLGQWQKGNQVFLVKLGKTGSVIRKIKIREADQFQYVIEVGSVDATTPLVVTIMKSSKYNFKYFSMQEMKELLDVEPLKTSYDLHFTTYNYTFWDQNPPLQYTVVGCLLNPTQTAAYKDSVMGYSQITKETMNQFPLSTKWDAIGYDWKKIDWASGSTDYVIDKRFTFLVKTQNNRYFKLRFLDFYGPTGEKGSPKFEFVEL